MELLGITTLVLMICVIYLVFLLVWKGSHKGRSLPPGPTPLPIIGNLMQLNFRNIPASLSEVRGFHSGTGQLQVSRVIVGLCMRPLLLQSFLVWLTTEVFRGVCLCVTIWKPLCFWTGSLSSKYVDLTWDTEVGWILANEKILGSEHILIERLPLPSAYNTYQKASPVCVNMH